MLKLKVHRGHQWVIAPPTCVDVAQYDGKIVCTGSDIYSCSLLLSNGAMSRLHQQSDMLEIGPKLTSAVQAMQKSAGRVTKTQ